MMYSSVDGTGSDSLLFSPLDLRSLRLKNRVMISPMAQYCAADGHATDWHLVHLGALAMGGSAVVFAESTKVERRGLGSVGDLGLWRDEHVPPLARITDFIKAQGASPAMQLNHSGRKARSQRPWEGFGPLEVADDDQWTVIGPSAIAHAAGWSVPREMTSADIAECIENWVAAARRALDAGFEILEIHGAHGYLVHQFLSPAANQRSDQYGGSLQNRVRFAVELTEAIRSVWPARLPLFFRVSAVDGMGWTIEDSIYLARLLKAAGVDVIDCSSGGMTSRSPTASQMQLAPGYQVPYAAAIRQQADVPTAAVGLILHAAQAEAVLQAGSADLIAVGREALFDPYWTAHAAQALGQDPGFKNWPTQYGWWLDRRRRAGLSKA